MFTKILKPEIMRTLLPEGFPADDLSQPRYKMVVEKDVFVTMRDGTRVAVDIFRPDAPGEFPSLYATSAYNKDLAYLPQVPAFHFRETNDIEYFVSRGYAYVHQDIRGSGKSVEGQWQFFSREEQNDFYDTVEWIAAQPWCNDSVGMIGESYLAWVQWFTAATQPPHLKCIVPFDGGADMYRDVAFHGGIMSVGFPTAWHMWEIRANYRLGRPGPDPKLGDWDMPWHVINHPTCDDFWKLRYADFSRIQCPVFSVGILHKVGIHLRGNVRGYEELTTPKKLLLCHGDFEGDEMAIFNSRRDAAVAAALVRPLAEGQRHRPHGRGPGDPVRARQGRVPGGEGLAAAADGVPQALPRRRAQRRRGVAQRRRALVGAPGRG